MEEVEDTEAAEAIDEVGAAVALAEAANMTKERDMPMRERLR